MVGEEVIVTEHSLVVLDRRIDGLVLLSGAREVRGGLHRELVRFTAESEFAARGERHRARVAGREESACRDRGFGRFARIVLGREAARREPALGDLGLAGRRGLRLDGLGWNGRPRRRRALREGGGGDERRRHHDGQPENRDRLHRAFPPA